MKIKPSFWVKNLFVLKIKRINKPITMPSRIFLAGFLMWAQATYAEPITPVSPVSSINQVNPPSDEVPRDFAVSLINAFMKLSDNQIEVHNLMMKAVLQNHLKNGFELIQKIKFCEEGSHKGGAVSQKILKQIVYIPRDLEEPSNVSIQYYLDLYKNKLPSGLNLQNIKYQFEDDLIYLRLPSEKSKVLCIKNNISLDDSVYILVHELVHFTSLEGDVTELDMLNYKTAEDYYISSVLKAGDEVDAYNFQIQSIIRHRGKSALGMFLKLSPYYSEKGQFLGEKKILVDYILNDLDYRKKRFMTEYSNLVRSQISQEETRLATLRDLISFRTQQLNEINSASKKRNRLLALVNKAYAMESQRISKLENKARESIARIKVAEAKQKFRLTDLQKLILKN